MKPADLHRVEQGLRGSRVGRHWNSDSGDSSGTRRREGGNCRQSRRNRVSIVVGSQVIQLEELEQYHVANHLSG